MQFLLLICLMVVCLPIDWPEPPAESGVKGGALLTALVAAALLFAAGLIALTTTRRLAGRPERREAIGHRYAGARTYFFFAQLAGYAACLWWLGWGWTARRLGTMNW